MQKRRRNERMRRRRRRRALFTMLAVLALAILSVYYVTRFPKDAERIVYPLPEPYKTMITGYADQYGLDPALVSAIVYTESSFNEKAESAVGARGLMQLMPDTGEWVAFRLGEEFDVDMLWDPDLNIRYGCWYLTWLADRYDGDMKCIAAAYHGGFGAVDKWLADPQYSSDGKTLLDIPYTQTSLYAKTVMERYEKYKEMYPFGS